MKKNVIVGLALCFLILGIVVIPVSYSFTNNNQDLIRIEMLQVEDSGDVSKIEATIKNQADEDLAIQNFSIILFDQEGEKLFEEPVYLGEVIYSGESRPLTVYVSEDVSLVSSARIVYELKG